jgi:hypothetical protein
MAVLLAFAPFYCWPWKPVINTLLGTPYAVALKNFKEQHADPANLALHVVALAATLAANFALLYRVDAFVPQPVPGARSVSAFTALAWAATLMNSPAPLSARLLSMLAIAWAFALASYVQPAQVKGAIRRWSWLLCSLYTNTNEQRCWTPSPSPRCHTHNTTHTKHTLD